MESSQTVQSSAKSIRAKSDRTWEYVTELISSDGRKQLQCNFCQEIFRGGGIHRMKKHLAQAKGDIKRCKKVPNDVRHRMQEGLAAIEVEKKEKGARKESSYPWESEASQPQVEEIQTTGISSSSNRTKKRSFGSGSYFPSGTSSGSQPTIKASMQSKEKLHQVDLSVARFMYDCCIPLNASNSFYWQPMADAIAAVGTGYKMPTYYALRTYLLDDMKKELQLTVDTYRSLWGEFGCTIMGDGWKDQRQRSLINFLVYCTKGTCFIKSVDASDMISNAETLCNLFSEIVEMVGATNVVQLITDSAANYKAVGRKLNEKYPGIVWTPCAAHCLNLILGDIGKMAHVESLVKRASSITIFVYNHKWTLSWLRRREGWKEILRPGETRFATTFIAMQSLIEHKLDLQALVVSKEFVDWNGSKTAKAKRASETILDTQFWNECLMLVKIITPIVKLLRIVDSDEQPALGYVCDGMYRTRKAIIDTFNNNKRLYEPYTKILDERWDHQMRQDIHGATYFLNPIFQYNSESHCQDQVIKDGFMSILADDNITVGGDTSSKLRECTLYRRSEGSFGSKAAKCSSKTTRPYEWWEYWGSSAPTFQKLALRLLSQTAASSGCERNWSVFERIHTKRRNKLVHQRLNDLVYVHYNLRLKNRTFNKNVKQDPIDLDGIDEIDSWIVEDNSHEPDMSLAQLEYLEEKATNNDEPILGSNSHAHDDDDE